MATDAQGSSKEMTAEHEQALKWAREQNFGSVSARYAKLCAEAYDIIRSETQEAFNVRVLGAVRTAHETLAAPAAVLQWAVNSFGAIALNRDERAARMTEEAIEVAQVEGVPLEVIQRIAARVYSRPVGELGQEIGGLMVGLYALAANSGVDPDAEFRREFDRVLSKPREHWARKHAEKVAAGTADLSPTHAQKANEVSK